MYKSKAVRNAYMRDYQKRQSARDFQRDRRAANRKQAIEMLGGHCKLCRSQSNLHFDHVDPATKTCNVSDILNRAFANIIPEIRRCQLLCGACHRTKTSSNHEYRPAAQHGSAAMYNRHRCRCAQCRGWKKHYDRTRRVMRKGVLSAQPAA